MWTLDELRENLEKFKGLQATGFNPAELCVSLGLTLGGIKLFRYL
jgi:hypothetical protein